MGTIFGASWVTSLSGALGVLFTALSKVEVLPASWNGWLAFIGMTFFGGGLIAAKDWNTSNSPKPAEAATVVEDKAESASAVPVRKIAP